MDAQELLDARGVPIAPGDTALYGFGVGRSVAMAEGVVLGKAGAVPEDGVSATEVSLTPSGRVRVRVIRRSYGGGEKPVVDIAPDRLVVLKADYTGTGQWQPLLPPSPLPTQDDENREKLTKAIASYTEALQATGVPDWWEDRPSRKGRDLADYHAFCARQLAEYRKDFRKIHEAE